jgi:hypothetical protein
MSLVDTLISRLGRPAGKALDPTIRDIVHAVLREHGYASPAEVQVLRDEARDIRSRVEGMQARLDAAVKMAEDARAAAAEAVKTARAEAEGTRTAAAAMKVELERQIAELSAARPAPSSPAGPAPAPAPHASGCKVPGCTGALRSKGFCSPHYQQWRRGNLVGFVGRDGLLALGDKTYKLKTVHAGGQGSLVDGKVFVDGKAV